MKLKALVSFSGKVGATQGKVFECSDKEIISDLINAGYAEEVKNETKRANAGKRSTSNKGKSELS